MKSRLSFLAGAAFLGAIGLWPAAPTLGILSGCSDKTTTPQLEPVIIGASVGLTSSQKSFAAQSQRAIVLAAAQLNAVGGILGRPFQVDLRDDVGSDPEVVKRGDEFLALGGKLAGFVGPSTGLETIAERFEREKLLLITPFSTAPEVLVGGGGDAGLLKLKREFTFRNSCVATPQAIALARLAWGGVVPLVQSLAPPPDAGITDASGDGDVTIPQPAVDAGAGTTTINARCTSAFVVNVNGTGGTGNGTAEIFSKEFRRLGGSIAKAEVVTGSEIDTANAAALTASLASSGADCLVMFLPPKIAGPLMREVRKNAQVSNIQAFGTIPLFQDTFLREGRADLAAPAGSPTAAEGVIGTACDTQPPTQEGAAFKNLYQTFFPKEDLTQSVPSAFDSVVLMALAIEQAKTTTDRVKLRQALLDVSKGGTKYGPGQIADALSAIRRGEDVDYQGVSGPCDFNADLDATLDLMLWRVNNAAFDIVARVGAAQVTP